MCNSNLGTTGGSQQCPNCKVYITPVATGKTHTHTVDMPKPVKKDPREFVQYNMPVASSTQKIAKKKKKKMRVDEYIEGEEFKQVPDTDEIYNNKPSQDEVWNSCLDLEIDG